MIYFSNREIRPKHWIRLFLNGIFLGASGNILEQTNLRLTCVSKEKHETKDLIIPERFKCREYLVRLADEMMDPSSAKLFPVEAVIELQQDNLSAEEWPQRLEIWLEEAFENPRKAARMTWRNLRLQAAIDGQKGTSLSGGRRGEIRRGIAGAVMRLTTVASYNALSPNQSVREYPTFLQLASAEQWYDYVRNMNQFDVSAELSIDVAPKTAAVTHIR